MAPATAFPIVDTGDDHENGKSPTGEGIGGGPTVGVDVGGQWWRVKIPVELVFGRVLSLFSEGGVQCCET